MDIKLFFDYPKRKDGFTGRENRRYWLVNTETGDKLKITEKQYDALTGLEVLSPQASSFKLQATSYKLGGPRPQALDPE